MIGITTLGSPESISLLCAALILFLLIHKKKNHLVQFAIFMALGALSVSLLKNGLRLPRPTAGLIEEIGYGFPSGHSTMATLFFSLLVFSYLPHIKNIIGRYFFIVGGATAPLLISYSRIYLGVHTWIDVVGGIFLGTMWFLLSIIFYQHLVRRDKNKAVLH